MLGCLFEGGFTITAWSIVDTKEVMQLSMICSVQACETCLAGMYKPVGQKLIKRIELKGCISALPVSLPADKTCIKHPELSICLPLSLARLWVDAVECWNWAEQATYLLQSTSVSFVFGG
jgi:hypothetical protein